MWSIDSTYDWTDAIIIWSEPRILTDEEVTFNSFNIINDTDKAHWNCMIRIQLTEQDLIDYILFTVDEIFIMQQLHVRSHARTYLRVETIMVEMNRSKEPIEPNESNLRQFFPPLTLLLCFKNNSLHKNIPKRGIIAACMC